MVETITKHGLLNVLYEVLLPLGQPGIMKSKHLTEALFPDAVRKSSLEGLRWERLNQNERIFVSSVLEQADKRGEDLLVLTDDNKKELFKYFYNNVDMSVWII